VKIGDTVEVLERRSLFDDPRGVVESMEYGRVKVRFADGWRRQRRKPVDPTGL
jgi:hypothetical protein